MRTREEFRALREMVGMTQDDLATILDVEPRAVRRWERNNDGGWYAIPQDAWDVLDEARADQVRRVDAAVEHLRGKDTVHMRYWLSTGEHKRLGSGFNWRMENADTRFIADALERLGVTVVYDPFEAG